MTSGAAAVFPGANVRAHTTEGCTVTENRSHGCAKTGIVLVGSAELGRAFKML